MPRPVGSTPPTTRPRRSARPPAARSRARAPPPRPRPPTDRSPRPPPGSPPGRGASCAALPVSAPGATPPFSDERGKVGRQGDREQPRVGTEQRGERDAPGKRREELEGEADAHQGQEPPHPAPAARHQATSSASEPNV